jgi:hypothetical protein
MQATSASTGWRHKYEKREVACALNGRFSANRAVEEPVFVGLRNSCNHVTEVGEQWGLWESRRRLSYKTWLCGCHHALSGSSKAMATVIMFTRHRVSENHRLKLP